MKFKAFFKSIVGTVILLALADLLLTWWSFRNYLMLHELNPLVNLLRIYGMTRIQALSLTFGVSMVAIIAGYYKARVWFETNPYNGGLRDVGSYLLNLESPDGVDLKTFSLIAVYLLFLYFHLIGILRWLDIFVL